MDASLPVAVGVVDGLAIVLTFKTRGVIYALIGGILVAWTEGWLMAIDRTLTFEGGVTTGCGISGAAKCGWALSTTDVQVTIVLLAILATLSFLFAINANRDKGGY
jgi:hypothetical protein